MRLGWFVSALAHIAFVCVGLIVWPHVVKPLDVESAIVPVEVVTFADKSNVTPIAPLLAAPAPTLAEQGQPQPTSQTPPEVTEAIAEKPPEAKPKKTQKPKTQSFNLDQLALLIDRAKKSPGHQDLQTSPKTQTGDQPRRGFGAQDALTTTELDALRAQLAKCWRAPVDMPNPERLIVRVHITLTRGGALASTPQVVSGVGAGDSSMRVAADNATRAVQMCAPFDLPAASYDRWRDITFTFDPREMIKQ